jgi:2'-5' RNA ligase
VNVDDDAQRAAFLTTCARHVAADGVVLIQRYDPAWAEDPQPSETTHGGVTIRMLSPRRDGERLTATVEYEVDGRTWRHGPFTSRILSDDELSSRLSVAGLAFDGWLDERRTWLAAVPAPDLSALHIDIAAAQPVVADLRRRWDPAGLAVPAHVTILFPFLAPAQLTAEADRDLARIAASVGEFDVAFRRVGRFPDVLWLAPEPAEPFARLTDAVARRWPDHPPYGGAFEQVIHHLTVADGAPAAVLEALAAAVTSALPVVERVSALTLSVRERGSWRVGRQYPLRGGAA